MLKDIFGIVGGNWKIGQAINLARNELEIDLERYLGRNFFSEWNQEAVTFRSEFRAISDGAKLNTKEMSILMCFPVITQLTLSERMAAGQKVAFWANLGVIRPQIADKFLQGLMSGTVLDKLAELQL